MSKSTLLGLVAAAVLIGACNGGEIGGLSSDLGPGSPRNGDLTATLRVSNGSRTVEATERAYDTLELELIARPGGARVDAGIAMATQQPVELSQAPIRVRFGEDGYIDVQDGGQWTNSTMIPYEAYVWYRIKISADVATDTYTVQVEPQYDVKRGPQQQRLRTLVEGAAFDRRGQQEKWLGVWGAWSSNDYTLDIAEPSWLVSGRCAPASCTSLGAECGVLGDGCGGTLSCGDCDSAQACRGGTCVDLCVPDSCVSLEVDCGSASDGCGGTLTCGQCADACVPDTCLSLGVECGAVSDGCGGTLSCGGCASGQACTGGICEDVCTPATCASWGVECGTLNDGCGGTLNCGGCPSGQVCGFGSCVSVSQPPPSCVPDTCQSLGVACGAASNGCGGTLSCGGCQSGQACLQGVCQNVCTPRTCVSLGVECGTVSDGCGGTLSCGGCGNGQACNAGVCESVCTPQTCVSLGVHCGSTSNGCGGTLSCGGCAVGQVCEAGTCAAASPPSCNPYTCSQIGASCGAQSDGCGGILSCGSCASGSTCSSGRCVAAGSRTFHATRTSCMAPCAVQLDAQKGASLTWPEVRDSEFIWDFDDGGSRTDSEGFLAAVVYESAGTYHPTVTVDGETWNPQTITVLEPTRTVCVGTDFSDCPSAASGDHFSTMASALAATNGEARRHVLLERGGSYGALPEGNTTPTMIGAYGTGAKPAVTAADVDLTDGWSFVDLAISGSGGAAITPKSSGGLLLRISGTGSPSSSWVSAYYGAFIIDSSIVSGAPYTVFPFDNVRWYVVKNSTIRRTSTGQHTIRVDGDGQEKVLIQNNQVLGDGENTAIRLSGTTSWCLIQGNWTNRAITSGDSQPGDPRARSYIIWERNAWDRLGINNHLGFPIDAHDVMVRNNIIYNGGGLFDYRAEGSNIWLINNTSVGNDTSGVLCNGQSGCVRKNNLVYSTRAPGGNCYDGSLNPADKNWCYTDDQCNDPVTASSGCYNPSFLSQTYGNANFMRPGAGTRGIDAGNLSVPIWNDYDNAPRTVIDVGAVER